MNKALWGFMALGLIAVGVLVGVMIPRPEAEPIKAKGMARTVFPARQGIVGKWEEVKHTPDRLADDPNNGWVSGESSRITFEFLADGTFIEVWESSALSKGSETGKWREIEGQRIVLTGNLKPEKVLSYVVQNDTLSLEALDGSALDATKLKRVH